MKASKQDPPVASSAKKESSSSMLRYLLFFFISIALGFGIGFYLGAFPKKNSTLQLIFSDEKQVPLKLLLDFEKSTGISFQAKVIHSYFLFQTEVQKADLIFVPFFWFENALPLMMESPDLKEFYGELFPDFTSLRLSTEQFLPLYWKIEEHNPDQKDLWIWGFAIGNAKSENAEEAKKLITYLTENPERLKSWTEQIKLSSTMEKSDSIPDFPENFKASSFRKHSLPQLKLKHQIEE